MISTNFASDFSISTMPRMPKTLDKPLIGSSLLNFGTLAAGSNDQPPTAAGAMSAITVIMMKTGVSAVSAVKPASIDA